MVISKSSSQDYYDTRWKERYEHTAKGLDPVELGQEVSRVLKEQGAYEIIRKLNEENN